MERMETSSLASRLVRGSFWSLAGSVMARGFGLIAAIVAARILGKASYGELGIIQSTVGMFGTLAGFGMGTTATKFVAEFRLTDRVRAGRIVALSGLISWGTSSVLALTLVGMSSWLCQRTLAAPQLTGCLRISALLLLLSGVNGAQNGVLSGFEAFKRIAVVNSLAAVLNFVAVLIGALLFGLPGMLWGMVVAQSAGCLLNFYALRQEASRHQVPISYSGWIEETSVIWRFSLPSVLGSLLISPVSWVCAAMLVRQPHGLEKMGAFNAANQWFGALMWAPYMLGGVTLPMLAERFGANDRNRSAKLLAASIKINAGLTFPVILVGCLCSHYIMAAFGEDFRREWPTLVATLITTGLLALQIPVGHVIAASGRMWIGFFMNLGWSVMFVGGTLLLLRWGALGLASARLLAYAAQGICAFLFAISMFRSMGSRQENNITAIKAFGDLAIK
jgi:O-antigen/teichoic acid export membrane protein